MSARGVVADVVMRRGVLASMACGKLALSEPLHGAGANSSVDPQYNQDQDAPTQPG